MLPVADILLAAIRMDISLGRTAKAFLQQFLDLFGLRLFQNVLDNSRLSPPSGGSPGPAADFFASTSYYTTFVSN